MASSPDKELTTNPTDMPMVKVSKSGIWAPAGFDGGGNMINTVVSPTISPKFEIGTPPMIGAAVQPVYVQGGEAPRASAGGEPGRDRDGGRDDDRDREQQRKFDEMTKQLEDLRKKFEELEEAKKKQDAEIAELKRQNEEKEAKIKELEEKNAALEAENEALKNPPPPEFDFGRFERAQTRLEGARDKLAELDILRSGRSNDRYTRRRHEDAEDYENALDEYKQALAEVTQLIIEQERLLGRSEAEIQRSLLLMKYAEDEKYTERFVEINDENIDNMTGWRGTVAKGLRRVANWPTWAKVSGGLLVGAGVGIASVTTGGGLALLVAGGAARFSWALTNHQASLRNVSRHSLEQQLQRISSERRRALRRGGSVPVDALRNDLVDATEDARSDNTERRQRRNRRATYLMVGGVVLTGMGISHALDLDLPSFSVGGWLHLHKPNFDYPFDGHGIHHAVPKSTLPGNHPVPPPHNFSPGPPPGESPWPMTPPAAHSADIMKNFHPDEFSGGKLGAPHDVVRNMFHVFNKNHIRVRGDNNKAIAAIIKDMQQHHWHLASGMEGTPGHLHQHAVDVAKDWADGHTGNYRASGLEGLRKIDHSSVENWIKFKELAERHGVKFMEARR